MRPASRDQFQVAIICALTLEADAVEALFDETYDKFGQLYGKQSGDKNAYITGRIGRHDVVLCYLPGMGVGSAAGVAANLHVSYTQIELAVIQYDFGRQYPGGFRRKSEVKETLGRPNQEIRAFLACLNGLRTRRELQDRVHEHLQSLQSQPDTASVWQRPDAVHDVLFEASYHHKHYRHGQASNCICFQESSGNVSICDEAMQKDCKSLGCAGNLVKRRRHGAEAAKPLIHIGPIASASTVMKSGRHRDRIAETDGAIGFEMEGAGVWDNGPCIIVKGVCDYADSHKNKLWQNYAAATAASCTKSLLEYWRPTVETVPARSSESPRDDMLSLISYTRKRELNLGNYTMENQEAKRRARNCEQLQRRLVNSTSMPLQVQWSDIVVLNDALGEIFYFSRNLIDSFALFVTILKRKFEHVGLEKIERNEWMLQDHRTGRVLNFKRHWKAIVKSGQILDMSMIFKRLKPRLLSIAVCPWCDTENECSLDSKEQHVECRNCFRNYRRIEELNEISLQPASWFESLSASDSQKQSQPKQSSSFESAILRISNFRNLKFKKLPELEPKDGGDDIHFYTRVQMVDVHFRVLNQEVSSENMLDVPEHLVIVRQQNLANINILMQYLARTCGLSEDDWLSALQSGYVTLFQGCLTLRQDSLVSLQRQLIQLPKSCAGTI